MAKGDSRDDIQHAIFSPVRPKPAIPIALTLPQEALGLGEWYDFENNEMEALGTILCIGSAEQAIPTVIIFILSLLHTMLRPACPEAAAGRADVDRAIAGADNRVHTARLVKWVHRHFLWFERKIASHDSANYL